jgi:adenylyltransferase/sulfurtransferase
MTLSADELERYQCQMALPELGAAGQQALQQASVLIVGLGGLGCPVATYLAAAGIGTLGLIDADRVQRSNLHRQTLYTEADLDAPKVERAAARLKALNPHITLQTAEARLTESNAPTLLADYDLVIDCTDNLPARYVINDAATAAGIPWIYGAISGYEGQVTCFTPGGPCYRCLFPTPPPADHVPACAQQGVLGVLPGLVGTLQATEAIKWLTGLGDSLRGRLLCFDARTVDFRTLTIEAAPDCACQSQRAAATPTPNTNGLLPPPYEIDVDAVKALLDAGQPLTLLDVREPYEWAICRLPDATEIPLAEVPRRLNELDPDSHTICICRSGPRSAQATAYLTASGFRQVQNMTGGLLAWAARVDPSMPTY